jgi:dipeptidyl aminopeptidase/acylaminoacyl peptidase
MIQQELVASQSDLMVVSLTGDHTPAPYLQTPFNEHSGRFSPDGKSVAYVSNESGRDELYVQSFPRTAAKIRISAAGGTHPEWNDDGRELYFLQAQPSGQRSMMVASVLAGGSSPPRRLFDLPPGVWEDSGRSMYAVFDNGRRFLVNVLVPIAVPQVITIGQNWTAALSAAR